MLKDYTMTPNRAGIPVWRPAQPVIGREDEHQTALTNWTRTRLCDKRWPIIVGGPISTVKGADGRRDEIGGTEA